MTVVRISPLILPIRQYQQAVASGDISAATSIAFSGSADPSGIGDLAAAEAIAFSTAATIEAGGALAASASTGFTAAGAMVAGPMFASTSIDFSVVATTVGTSTAPVAISPLVLPIRQYIEGDKQPNLQSNESIAFTDDVVLTAKGGLGFDNLQFATTIEIIGTSPIWLIGSGQLQAAAAIDFSATAQINFLQGLVSLSVASFTTDATLSATGQLQGSTSIDFAAAGVAGSGILKGAEVISFAAAAATQARGSLQGSTTIVFENPGQLFRSIVAATVIDFQTGATLSADYGVKITGQWWIDVVADPWDISVCASDWHIDVPAEDWNLSCAAADFSLAVEPKDGAVKAA